MTASPIALPHRSSSLIERRLRLSTGLILFGYAICHFVNHAFGLVSLQAMDTADRFLVDPWTTLAGHVLLYGSFGIHAALGLKALFRRRQLWPLPLAEAAQLLLGLGVPILLIRHVVHVRLGAELYDFRDSYEAILSGFWLFDQAALTRQFALLFVVWVHGCIGVHASLRLRSAYAQLRPWLAAIAILVPLLAVAGVYAAGADIDRLVQKDFAFTARNAPPELGSPALAARMALNDVSDRLTLAWMALVAGTLAARLVRSAYARRFGTVQVMYRDGKTVRVTRGFSVLEASRLAGRPHASICGGRGRCSTCRVRVLTGEADLPPPNAIELATLKRIGAPPYVRLACQLRPVADVSVVPLLAPGVANAALADGSLSTFRAGQEREIVALFADLRDSTRLTAGRLPFDALFLVDCWIQAVSGAVHKNGGNVTSVAGDGVMAVFGTDVGAAQACQQALATTQVIRQNVAALNRDLGASLSAPLRFGVGIHVGLAIIGETTLVREDGARSLQFFGDPGNVASRLEALTKEHGCDVLASRTVLDAAGVEIDPSACFEIAVRGRDEIAPLLVCVVARSE
jgi:adenylate cyclase